MLGYFIRRILFFVPTLIAISLLTFFISVNAPGDPVELMLNRGEAREGSQGNKISRNKDYAQLRHKLGLDLPLFYFSLTDATVSDTIHKIDNPQLRTALKRLSNEYGIWENVSAYYHEIRNIHMSMDVYPQTVQHALAEWLNELEKFEVNEMTFSIVDSIEKVSSIQKGCSNLKKTLQILVAEKNPYCKYVPSIHWHGFNNQYHRWLMNFFTGDFGISFQDKRAVSEKIRYALPNTLGISLLSILLAYSIAIPLGVYSAVNRGTSKEKAITILLFVLYSLPNFWIATMLVFFFCGGDYFSWFPDPGYVIPDDASFIRRLFEGLYVLLLPLFCWTYGSLAFISRQMRGGILQSITQDYIQTARAKGLDDNKIIWKHAFKNSLLPLITLFGSIFPLAISGSFVIENIFNIPGMGKLTLDAFASRDYPVIFTVMMFTSILTMLGNFVSDLLYAAVDPRISYSKSV